MLRARRATQALALGLLLLGLTTGPVAAGELQLSVDHLRNERGQLLVAIYSADARESFPKHPELALKRLVVPADRSAQALHIDGLPPGRFAVSVVHDENANGTMDHNFFGLPTEGFGFSNNPTVRFSLPSFDDAAFTLDSEPRQLHVSLTYW
jgi:uncharacterized protein (DUF2141 family)